MRGCPWRKKPRAMLLGVLTVMITGYVGYRVDTGNFQIVVPGKVYRSGQLTEGQWVSHLQKYAIKSLLNPAIPGGRQTLVTTTISHLSFRKP
jgi:hypothetical protein